jgi:undecaprenol kinase
MEKLLKLIESVGRSIGYAFRGFYHAVKTERNLRIELIIGAIAIVAGIILGLDLFGWILVAGSAFLVIVCELFNTAIEILCDIITDEHSNRIRVAKDVAAASVLLSCLIAFIIGILVFGHQILLLIRK